MLWSLLVAGGGGVVMLDEATELYVTRRFSAVCRRVGWQMLGGQPMRSWRRTVRELG